MLRNEEEKRAFVFHNLLLCYFLKRLSLNLFAVKMISKKMEDSYYEICETLGYHDLDI
jgi:hypothetical protein